MNIFVDENIPNITVTELKNLGYNVIDIRGTALEGSTDEVVWKQAQDNHCLLITTDKGFSKHRFEKHHGILIVTLRQPNQLKIHQRIISALKNFNESDWNGKLLIMKDSTSSLWRFNQN